MNLRTTANIRTLVLNRRDTSWGPGRWAANGALAEAVDNVAEPLLAAAEYGAARKAKQAGYARKSRKSTKAERELRKAVKAFIKEPFNWFLISEIKLAAHHLHMEAISKPQAALTYLARTDAELLEAAE